MHFRSFKSSVLYICEEGNKKRHNRRSDFFYYLGVVALQSLMHGFD
ncbi:unnamed protein product [Musa acuminata subsp. malaccensis]|uniref:Uncharacterized protein n=1 Tax=Musa acuminata subsp. malaccensis TaxID=214687 RepID=A0A804U5K7_MUSAM|nr:unnamed protein product [Musa acuminata subsp. malaccensis]